MNDVRIFSYFSCLFMTASMSREEWMMVSAGCSFLAESDVLLNLPESPGTQHCV